MELFSDFSKPSEQDWVNKISQDLKGKSLDDLKYQLEVEGIEYNPVQTRSDRKRILFRPAGDWKISLDFIPFKDVIGLQNGKSDSNSISDNDILEYLKKEGNALHVNATDFLPYGASSSQELAFACAMLNEYLSRLEDANSEPSSIEIQLSIGADFYVEIAKFRAFRILTSNIFNAYKRAIDLKINASNNTLYYSAVDSNTNLLRATTQCMSAILGGCDSVYIRSHQSLLNTQQKFGNRISENIQHLMKHESHLNKIIDPLSGSYFIEHLTDLIAERAWNIFQDIENMGGYLKYFESGDLKKSIDQSFEKQLELYRSGKYTLIGINKYKVDRDVASARQVEPNSNAGLFPRNIESQL